MSFVYDKEHVELLKRSLEQIGSLRPVLVDSASGQVLGGRHRKFADPNWPESKIDVKDDLQRELIILHDNVQRVISAEETKARLVRIAKELESRGISKDKVCKEMYKIVPYDDSYIRKLLPPEYKMTSEARSKESALLVARITDTMDMGEVQTALDEIGQPSLSSGGPRLPFPNCKCGECTNKTLCY